MFLHNWVHLAFTTNRHQGLTGGCFVWTRVWMGFHTSLVKSDYFGVSASRTKPNADFIIACHMFCDRSLNVLLEQVKGHTVLAVSVLLWSRLNQGLERAGCKMTAGQRYLVTVSSVCSLFLKLFTTMSDPSEQMGVSCGGKNWPLAPACANVHVGCDAF